tara:strand:+ start:178 stop:393 length:216 start_codon:yes stop_codon:yes gene_type:complete
MSNTNTNTKHTYTVPFTRTVDEYTQVTVEAASPEEAKDIAYEKLHEDPFGYEWESGSQVVDKPEAHEPTRE